MEIRSHYNLGDPVWLINLVRVERFEECPSCKQGQVPLPDGRSLKCPRCDGKGAIAECSVGRWRVKRKLTVGQIRIEIAGKLDDREQYMCQETGVGSGSVYNVSDLYSSEALAQAECDKRNNAGEQDWVCSRCQVKYEPIVYSLGFENRDWRHCSVHGSSQQVVKSVADKKLEEREAYLKKLDEEKEH